MVNLGAVETPVVSDPRMDFLQEWTMKALRVKPDKWTRMTISDEQRTYLHSFIERSAPQVNVTVIGIQAYHCGIFRSW